MIKTENEIIAEFMGWERYSGNSFKCPNSYPIENSTSRGWTTFTADQLQFNTSCDWLIPAIRKLLTAMNNGSDSVPYDLGVQMNSRRGGIERHIWDYLYGRVDLIDVYNEFVSCLKWYNANKTLTP